MKPPLASSYVHSDILCGEFIPGHAQEDPPGTTVAGAVP